MTNQNSTTALPGEILPRYPEHYVAVYDCSLAWGGREEGGWWYDQGSLVRIIRAFENEDRAYEYCRRMNGHLRSRLWGPNKGKREYTSVLSEGELTAHVYQGIVPRYFPERKPHYE